MRGDLPPTGGAAWGLCGRHRARWPRWGGWSSARSSIRFERATDDEAFIGCARELALWNCENPVLSPTLGRLRLRRHGELRLALKPRPRVGKSCAELLSTGAAKLAANDLVKLYGYKQSQRSSLSTVHYPRYIQIESSQTSPAGGILCPAAPPPRDYRHTYQSHSTNQRR
jgi:hypothetical protein